MRCIENSNGLMSIEYAFFHEFGLFYRGRELEYPGYQRGAVRVLGVNSTLCILISGSIPKPSVRMPVEFDEIVLFNIHGKVQSFHSDTFWSEEGPGGIFEIETDVHLTPRKRGRRL
jgi:hypothetical protein